MYLRLRGEDYTVVTTEEVQERATRRHLTAQSKSEDPEVSTAAWRQLLDHIAQHPEGKLQTFQLVGQGGDKYRLTLVTFQAVTNWFNPALWPEGQMPKYVLIVPCTQHARLENIDDQGRWIETVLSEYCLLPMITLVLEN